MFIKYVKVDQGLDYDVDSGCYDDSEYEYVSAQKANHDVALIAVSDR